jgi:hypothetical protein
LKKADIDVSTLSSAAKDVLEQLGGATRGLIDQIMKNMVALNAVDQSGVFGVVIPKISKGEIPFYIIRSLFVSFESFRDKICNSLESYPKKIVVGNIPAIKEMRSKDQKKIDNLLTIWEKSGIIDKESIKTIKEKGK